VRLRSSGVGPISAEQALFLAILIVAIALLISEKLRPDVVAVLIILALAGSHLLSSSEAFSGLSSEPAIVIACMFVLSAGLQTTGVSELMGRAIGRLSGGGMTRMLAVIMPAAAVASAFTHHVMITGVMLPITLTLARDRQIPASKLLMPVAIASSLGTTITILGAPSFLVSSELLRQAGREGLGIFSVAPIGIALTVLGTAYMLLVGRFLVPSRKGLSQSSDALQLDSYLTELHVVPDSPLIGKTANELAKDRTYPFEPVGLVRDGHRQSHRAAGALCEGDVLLIRTSADGLATIRQEPGWELEPVLQYADALPESAEDRSRGAKDQEAALDKVQQAIVAPRSWFGGRSVADVDFLHRYQVVVLGIWRRTRLLPDELSHIRLREGDVLVLQGSANAFERMANDRNFLLLTPFEAQVRRPRRALVAGLVMLATIVGATLSQVGLGVATLGGAAAMVLTGCLTPREAHRAVDARMYLFVAGAIPLGLAMKNTGTADLLAHWLQSAVAGLDERLILLALFLVVGAIVQFMGSDSATVALFGPVAIALAATLGQAPEAYVVTVAVAAVTAVLTPMSHHNLIIYAPGGYRFFDYARVGAPLTLVLAIATAILAPRVWPA
jgi:di/tricarboxylate transporter